MYHHCQEAVLVFRCWERLNLRQVLQAAYSTELPTLPLASWLSKLDYNLLDRYHFSASYRRDGSSRFSKESRWGISGGGCAWNVKKEDFLRSVKDIDNLNVRFSMERKATTMWVIMLMRFLPDL
jgi:hypothetical protein